MKHLLVLFCLLLTSTSIISSEIDEEARYVFFLHNQFLEDHALDVRHPQFGRAQYKEILAAYEESGFTVISEKRKGNVYPKTYALSVRDQIDELIEEGVDASRITVVGTSKGGYIAQYVSTFCKNPDLNFVFIGCFQSDDIQFYPEIEFCGNILNIFEKSDPLGSSALERKEVTSCEIPNFKEVQLDTGLGHGFLFKPLKEWIDPSIKWAKGDYALD